MPDVKIREFIHIRKLTAADDRKFRHSVWCSASFAAAASQFVSLVCSDWLWLCADSVMAGLQAVAHEWLAFGLSLIHI